MLTDFGKYLREYRASIDESLRDMAKKLGFTHSYLSAIELGKREIPPYLLEKIFAVYNFDAQQKNDLICAYMASIQTIKWDVGQLGKEQKAVAVFFVNQFASFDNGQLAKVCEILGACG